LAGGAGGKPGQQLKIIGGYPVVVEGDQRGSGTKGRVDDWRGGLLAPNTVIPLKKAVQGVVSLSMVRCRRLTIPLIVTAR
jgi:hypothetical protein